MMKNNILCIILLFFVASCQRHNYQKFDDNVLIKLKGTVDKEARLLRLQVISDKIIHITASPTDTFPSFTSLVTGNHYKGSVKWDLEQNKDELVLKTSCISANISLVTGEITFSDSTGNILLREQHGGGKTFIPVSVEGKQFYNIKQVFESPDDEALYGLGQHQNGQMNYKGQDVELIQHNIVAVVPFLYSTKDYGILWDNYSITRFGDPREFQPISSLNLFSKSGEPGGLTAEYYSGSELKTSRPEKVIGYEYLQSMDNWPQDIPMLNSKVIWEGSFSSDIEGEHKFLFYASEYYKLWIDDKLIYDDWRQGWNPWHDRFTVNLKKGEKHKIKLVWLRNEGHIALKHLDPLGSEKQNRITLSSEVGEQIDYYFIHGTNADEVIQGYRLLTGKAPIMPKWAMGFWQSRERYITQNELLGVVKEYRKREIPIDNIILDWQYWEKDKWGSHEFDSARFPDPGGMIKELHEELNTRIMVSVWPKFYRGIKNFKEMQKNGYLYQRNLEKECKDWIGYVSTFYDAFNADARELFWNQINPRLNSIGFDGWWLDATEPDMGSNNSIEERKKLMNPTALGPGAQYFNPYSLMNAKGVYEGLRESDSNKRIFILTRSAFAGQQRYAAATWSGDVASRWSKLGDQISAGLNFSLSGIPYWTHDIGGFSVEKRYENAKGEDLKEWRELNTRWFQFGAFSPLFRSHGQLPYREIYNIAPENSVEYKSMVYYDKLRYSLMPYIYTLAGKTYHNDYTIMRALVMDFADDTNVHNIGDQYMLGPALMVCPVYKYKARSRNVYLPALSGWYDFYSGKYYEGGRNVIAEAPLERIPLFVREGSIIPFGPEIQYSDEKPANPLTLYIYTGEDGYFELYEDENVNYNYKNDKYSTISFSYNDESGTVKIGKRKGSFPGMIDERLVHIVLVSKDKPTGWNINAPAVHAVNFNGEEQSIKLKISE